MGKIKQGILGGFRGTVGTVIGSSWNGIAYMKGKPQSVRNPRTDAQVQQRNFFKEVQELVGQISDEQLVSLFPSATRGLTRRNMLTRQIAACAAFVDDVKTVDLSSLEGIGNGERIDSPMLESLVSEIDGSLAIYAEETAVEIIGKPSVANFIAVAYNLTQKKVAVFNTEVTDPSMGVTVPVGNWAEEGDSVRFYLTYSTKGENVSSRGFGSFFIKTRAEKSDR
ncbi:MAG: hypothetical protein J6W30_01355 [Bacteroidales bacterium]|nr:hypothetical protein [Bacteroidales bacterium]